VPFELYNVRRAATVLLAVAGVLAVGLTWAQVVRKIADATPPSSPVEATSVVWGDRVFQTERQLTAWLRFHGVAYSVWSGRHPFASSAIEHRPLHIARQGPPAQPAVAKSTPRTAADRSTASSRQSRGGEGGFPTKTLVIALLALLAAAAALAASAPGALRYRHPEVAHSIADHRDLLLAGAAALLIGIITGVFLN
jgi:hypothetical protein